MRKVAIFALAGLMVALTTLEVLAWEFTMKGEAEYRYRYWTRTGNRDIFGQMNSTACDLGINHLVTFPTTGTTTRIGNAGANGLATFGVLAGENRFGILK